jgi:nitrate/nitrite-specific signal transduction histidine kinase
MIASAIIMAFSMGSLLAWFRYSCGLILSAKPAHDYTPQVAAANELGVLEVQQSLPNANERRVLDTLASVLPRSLARRALQEMTQVVCYFANTMGERGVWTSVAE